ncbi:amino acid adenylation domain-containing protein [Nostoc sp. CENA67]|uniref:Amino acid adenylation domain-containing protein n=1 Tax=Amazonocrinis nigriterrae CENA67 TaxID=2794033 RepID=A0A8J7HQS4_9NOST|nr:non-ribosomal peptide synthetase [Amazonocrinis nigriterrae]MBH8561815.1 amino acid adenylation domain-containing protein [Amazonocrinis nigriterrae CENA67]
MTESDALLQQKLNLSPAKRALFEKLVQGKLRVTTIPRRQQSDSVFLSFAQERLWFFEQLTPNQYLYNEPSAFRLQGKLNVDAVVQSINEIVRRHEILRTTFTTVDGQAQQIIAPSLTLELPIVNLESLALEVQESEVRRLATVEAQQPFNLKTGSLLRVTLLQLDAEEYVLLLTMHHIICDRWSSTVLMREIAALYSAFSQNQPSPLPQLPIQYADFAVWQRQWLVGEVLEKQISYWQQQLHGAPSLLELPTDRPRPALMSYRGAEKSVVLSKELTQKLKQLAQQESATLFMTLLAAFQTLLYRYTQQEDILVGTTIAGRNREELEGLIGFFVNTLVLRTNLSGNPSFRELLSRVRDVALGAYAHQDLPFERLVEKLQPQRNLSHTPLFQVMFQLQNTPTSSIELPDLTLMPLKFDNETAKFDLTLEMAENESGMIANLEYNTDIFYPETIIRLLKHFQILLEGIVVNPDQRLSDLPLLTASEENQLLKEWNNTQNDYPQDQCIHQFIEVQAEKIPHAIAVVFEEQYLTYQELNQKANQLAHYLQKRGVGPEVLVGICVERSLEMIVGILGILKAGGAYVPLDPAYPQERLTFMLEDANLALLLTQQRLQEWLPQNQHQTIYLDADWQLITQENHENLQTKATTANLAYVIYTSGSTGKPKGVMVQHHSLVNYTETAIAKYALKASDRVLQFASICFDAAAEEIFPCLVQGATLVLRNDAMLSSIPAFLQQCQKWEITVLDLPTAFWHQMTGEIFRENLHLPEELRLVIIGGEKGLSKYLRIWRKYVNSQVQLINSYGPTEATIVATISNLSNCQIQNPELSEVPIGKAIDNVQVYILDSHLQPNPISVPGELYIGGMGIARGYLNQPQLTAEKFIPNPFSNELGTRLYKTGDLARYLPNGEIDILGRVDDQVKIRGFRIELGEIEARLNQHPKVNKAVVKVWEDEQGDKRLVGYVSSQSKPQLTVTQLRSFLKEQLPEYMIPSAFVILENLPLTPNGKIDQRTLPVPERFRPELAANYVIPQTEIEQTIANIWQKALNLENIGIHDNFFELGGHSLLMIKVHSELRESFKTDLAMLDLFRYPTISSLADLLSQFKNQTSSIKKTDNQAETITTAKEKQRKRLEKMKSLKNI